MNIWELRVYGIPVPQGRPRAFVTKGGHASVYDPTPSRVWKNVVRAQVIAARPRTPVQGAFNLTVDFILPRPVSLPKRVIFHTKRPDCSNLLKAVEDAMLGIVYRDDSQAVEVRVGKRYGEPPGVGIKVEALEETF